MMIHLQKDMKLLRFLAMKKGQIYRYILGQVMLLVVISTIVSGLVHHLVLVVANNFSSPLGIVLDQTKFYPQEIYTVLSYISVILISTLIYVGMSMRGDRKK